MQTYLKNGYIVSMNQTDTVFDGGEHWLHTPDEIEIMNRWEEKELKF